jgi:cytochrome c-type biogenesis protein CcmH/NrfF
MTRLGVVTAAVCLALVASPSAAAEPQDVANDIADEVMSPFCPGVTLLECPSSQSYELRGEILGWVEKGWDKERIMDRLEQQFGPGIRATPRGGGSGLVAWVVPGLAVAAAAGVMVLLLRRWCRAGPHRDEVIETPISAEDRLRLSAELEEVRRQTW